ALGFAMRALLDGGALDVFLTPVYMKKSRPAYMLTALCRPEDDDRVTQLIFRHTTTIGVRRHAAERSVLSRRVEIRNTRFGDVRVKVSEGFGVRREKPEHGDVAGLAGEYGVTLDDVLKEL
ncbi:MAG: LarC family nickel insertion protein, partial [Clostridiales bacterium]|nr:LarC family nickel insertion protein [Clostridiales bacterium]